MKKVSYTLFLTLLSLQAFAFTPEQIDQLKKDRSAVLASSYLNQIRLSDLTSVKLVKIDANGDSTFRIATNSGAAHFKVLHSADQGIPNMLSRHVIPVSFSGPTPDCRPVQWCP